MQIDSKSPGYIDSFNNSWAASPEKIEKIGKNASTEKIVKNKTKSPMEVV